MGTSGFVFEDLVRGSSVDFSDQFGPEMPDLNLGMLGCLENSWFVGSEKSPLSMISTTSTGTASKRMKPPSLRGSTIRHCQVDTCNLDISWAKYYHQRFRVCDYHSKSSVAIVKGLECRFCQQCSRFHSLSEFDQRKRSCRKGLSAHNARRRNHRERIALKSSSLPNSSFYGFKDVTSTTLGESPDLYRALSLLSTSSCGSCESVLTPFGDTMHGSRMNMPQTPIDAVPLSSFPPSEYWLDSQPSTYPLVHYLTSGITGTGLDEGIQHPKTSYGTDFYFSHLH